MEKNRGNNMFKKKCVICGKNTAKFCQSCFEDMMNQNVELQTKLYEAPDEVAKLKKENEELKDKLDAIRRYMFSLQRYVEYIDDEIKND